MNLYETKLGTNCIVKEIKIADEKTKFRLMELGLIRGVKIKVNNKSVMKKTLLVVFNSCCFTMKVNIAKSIEVEYA